MWLNWRMWVDATSERKALKLCDRVLERMGRGTPERRVEPYPKTGGFVLDFATRLEAERWNDAVVEAISLGQRVAHGWVLSGSVEDDPAGSSSRTNISGVKIIDWRLMRPAGGGDAGLLQ